MSIYLSIYIYTSTYTIIYIGIQTYTSMHPHPSIHPSIHPPTRMQRHTHTYMMYTHNSEIFRDLWIYIPACIARPAARPPGPHHPPMSMHVHIPSYAHMHAPRPPMCRCQLPRVSQRVVVKALAYSAVSRRLAASVEKGASAGQPPPTGHMPSAEEGLHASCGQPHMPAPSPRVHGGQWDGSLDPA